MNALNDLRELLKEDKADLRSEILRLANMDYSK